VLSPFNDPDEPLSFKQKFRRLNWFIPFNMAIIATIGAFMLYSAANGNIDPWASKHILRFAIGLCLMIGLALLPTKFWYHISYPAFIASIMLLVWVELSGHIGMGAQRWVRLFGVALQPSEVTKITLLLALSRYFHDISNENNLKITEAIPAMLMIIVPVGLILKQPDLGTALMLMMAGVACLFLAGLAKRWFFMAGGGRIGLHSHCF
jgi:rod shape determining protein RodA